MCLCLAFSDSFKWKNTKAYGFRALTTTTRNAAIEWPIGLKISQVTSGHHGFQQEVYWLMKVHSIIVHEQHFPSFLLRMEDLNWTSCQTHWGFLHAVISKHLQGQHSYEICPGFIMQSTNQTKGEVSMTTDSSYEKPTWDKWVSMTHKTLCFS